MRMANEAKVFAEGPDNCIVRQFTVADGTAVTKGALFVASGSASRTGIVHTAGALSSPLGFAVSNKAASDGETEIGFQRTGVVDATFDGAFVTGQLVIASKTTANRVQALTNADLSRYEEFNLVLGRALEGGADGAVGRVAVTLG